MVVEFQATVDDFADITRRGQRRVKATPFSTKGLLITALIGTLGVVAIPYLDPLEKLQAIAVLIITYAAMYAFLFADYGPFYKRTIRQIYSRQFGPEWPVKVRVDLDEAGLTFTQNGIRDTTDWAAIEGIQETADAIYFLGTDNSVMAVRKRAFSSPADLAQFLTVAQGYLRPQLGRSARPELR